MKTIPINVDAELSVEEIVRVMGREQVVELIKALDVALADWDLTLELCDHFDKLREDYAREAATEAASKGE